MILVREDFNCLVSSRIGRYTHYLRNFLKERKDTIFKNQNKTRQIFSTKIFGNYYRKIKSLLEDKFMRQKSGLIFKKYFNNVNSLIESKKSFKFLQKDTKLIAKEKYDEVLPVDQNLSRNSDKNCYVNKKIRLVKNPILFSNVATCCFTFCYLTVLAWAVPSPSPMPPRVRSEHVARYINFTKLMGKEPLPSTFLTTTELIAARSLVPEEHYIITEDGYILNLYRLYSKKDVNRKRPPILIMHGLMASSDSWLVGERSTSLPIFLADMGYDVWIGDQRGNANSRKHVFLNTRSPQFWNFSFHESGYYDLPAFVDHVLTQTGHSQLIYVGHSMATAAFLVMGSTRPEYNSKIKLACLLAPVAYLRKVKELDFFFLQFYSQSDLLIKILQQAGLYEILPRSITLMQLTKMFCGSPMTRPLCILAIKIFLRQNPQNIDVERAGFIFSYVPAGSSLKMLKHFASNIKSGRFQNYDYGEEGNMKKYKSKMPYEYDLKKVTAPVALYYSLNDIFLNKRSATKTARELSNLVHFYEVPDKKYSHADYVLGLNSKEVLFKDLLKLMYKYS